MSGSRSWGRHHVQIRRALRIYAITPPDWTTIDRFVAGVQAGLAAGVTCVQLRAPALAADQRAEIAFALVPHCRAAGVPLVINNDVDLALASGADGVHLGAADMALDRARLLAPDLWIGASAGTLERALHAMEHGADSLGVGAIYDARATKADASSPRGLQILAEIRRHPALAHVPVVAIGGINANNAAACLAAGADGVAAVRELLGASDIAAAVAAMESAHTDVARS